MKRTFTIAVGFALLAVASLPQEAWAEFAGRPKHPFQFSDLFDSLLRVLGF